MSIWKRALLQIERKRGRTIILFFLFFVMSSLVLTGLAIRNSTDRELKKLREKVGATFTVGGNDSQKIDDKNIKKIMTDNGILDFNGENISYMAVQDIMLEPGHFAGSGEIWEKVPRFISDTKSELNQNFYNGEFDLIQGRHILKNDNGKILISESIASYNGLQLGDTITAYVEEILGADNQNAIGKKIELEIVGIFRIASKQNVSADAAESTLPQNFIFTDNNTGHLMYQLLSGKTENIYRNGVVFYLKDPKELENVLERLGKRGDINFEQYNVIKNNKEYLELANPLENLYRLINVLVLITVIISILFLSLILTFWIRDRIYEIGIYLSLGIGKLEIIKQFLTECLMVALISYGGSFCLSGLALQQLGNVLLNKLSVSTGVVEWALTGIVGILIICISISIASFFVIRLKPRDILSRMS